MAISCGCGHKNDETNARCLRCGKPLLKVRPIPDKPHIGWIGLNRPKWLEPRPAKIKDV